ncbi:MAG: C4-dicarboxylate ABC transporter, partial [Silicimonas sp.]|nr:C4-dicarboxylate ABC transporter [Silicimonas sp.]
MELLSLISFLTLNEWMVLLIFLVFIYLLFSGVPVAYALVGVSLGFAVLAAFVLDP